MEIWIHTGNITPHSYRIRLEITRPGSVSPVSYAGLRMFLHPCIVCHLHISSLCVITPFASVSRGYLAHVLVAYSHSLCLVHYPQPLSYFVTGHFISACITNVLSAFIIFHVPRLAPGFPSLAYWGQSLNNCSAGTPVKCQYSLPQSMSRAFGLVWRFRNSFVYLAHNTIPQFLSLPRCRYYSFTKHIYTTNHLVLG